MSKGNKETSETSMGETERENKSETNEGRTLEARENRAELSKEKEPDHYRAVFGTTNGEIIKESLVDKFEGEAGAEKESKYNALTEHHISKESGKGGRVDLYVEPKDDEKPAAIVEFKTFDASNDEKGGNWSAAEARATAREHVAQVQEYQKSDDVREDNRAFIAVWGGFRNNPEAEKAYRETVEKSDVQLITIDCKSNQQNEIAEQISGQVQRGVYEKMPEWDEKKNDKTEVERPAEAHSSGALSETTNEAGNNEARARPSWSEQQNLEKERFLKNQEKIVDLKNGGKQEIDHTGDIVEAQSHEFRTQGEVPRDAEGRVDLDRLSANERRLYYEMLHEQGRPDGKCQEVLDSGNNFQEHNLQKGDKLYGFVTDGDGKSKQSPYWTNEAEFERLKGDHYQDGKWKSEGVKQEFALPCYNRANGVMETVVKEDHLAVESRIAPATENLYYRDSSGKEYYYENKRMTGGGNQLCPDQERIEEPKRHEPDA